MKTMHEGAAAALHPSTQAASPTAASAFPSAALGLDGLKVRTPALVTGLVPARDGREHSTLLRLLEIGFVPGEAVQVLARGAWGGNPLAVRVGQATFALRQQEAAMVQVQVLA
ncbi:ferrous iron transport protein A [Acidovorax sp. 56]|uniref:FeoA family protein n=1 Tax=Acidovorax sp. 56 TaxID=2035205 RepID=UPI000C16A118|nr:FeoA family protein [Acidovorax sp. 56]PIF25312.1 ferrous iron transport protein A [Acidovorax sp. 56]